MPDVKGINFTKIGTENVIARGLWNSLVLVQADEYEAAVLAADSTIKVAQLPAGAKVLNATLYFDALGAGVTLSLGYAGAATKYLNAVAAATAGSAQMSSVDGVQDALAANTDIIITTGGAAATGTIRSIIFYSL